MRGKGGGEEGKGGEKRGGKGAGSREIVEKGRDCETEGIVMSLRGSEGKGRKGERRGDIYVNVKRDKKGEMDRVLCYSEGYRK